MNELIELVANYGIGVVCVLYMIYFQNTTMKEMTSTMVKMTTTLEGVNVRLSFIEDKLEIANDKDIEETK